MLNGKRCEVNKIDTMTSNMCEEAEKLEQVLVLLLCVNDVCICMFLRENQRLKQTILDVKSFIFY